MARNGIVIVTFDTLKIYTSELIDFNYTQTWNIVAHDTISNQALTQPGALGIGKIQLKAELRLECADTIASFYNLFRQRKLATLNALKIDYGLCYFSDLNYEVRMLDDVQAPLIGSVDLTFMQSNEGY